ncbi:amidohydrolase [Staphylococcus intermedius]|uniref:Peptidase M20 domain-containing protein 2 n=1 Tax=Staphylococcus intermedius NCTC 11048 TaxID=1141106 RepID=A0A380G3B6_STAIN|nr:amidohydrolase [Staphylococcus intermedius]PCF64189.1 amidohydrolase [Staphylococcus intermedius]PCF78904.1 amidohydrolase [Staphylococcus intermedius]PCF79876.1 amidohydrolase [Staphylococcus intermedius]PCF89464.1 amidohydrolase [Staphylococcus intermedius]SUM45495.1 amidohydrolase family protein [Staphylococcus intermedius NCTC 11048]
MKLPLLFTPNEEFKAVKQITSILDKYGFDIERHVADLPTAFIAKFDHHMNLLKEPYTIGLICEYDALAQLGHGCGHQLQTPSIIGAAIATIKAYSDLNFITKVIGTPAEETTSGKLPMQKAGVFKDLDLALMMQGSDRTTADTKSLAINKVDFEFTGAPSHAAVSPKLGRSALDGVMMLFNGIEYLRKHVTSDVRMHGIITNGGQAVNIVLEFASAQFSFRAEKRSNLNQLLKRMKRVAEGAAHATETEVTIKTVKQLESKVNVQTLNDVLLKNNEVLLKNAELAGASRISPPREKTGSTDFNLVTHHVPGACLRTAFVPLHTPNHTKAWVDSGKLAEAHAAIQVASKALSYTIADFLTQPTLRHQINSEFKQAYQEL